MGKVQIGTSPGKGAARPANLEEVRGFVRDQKKVFGQVFTTSAGTQVDIPLIFPTAGAFLLGLAFVQNPTNSAVGVPIGTVNIQVNNEQFVSGLPASFLDVTGKTFEYYEFPRPLSGVDKVVLQVTDTASRSCYFAVYYI